VLYEQRGNLELNSTHFKQMIEAADLHLQGLFNKLVKALIPNNRSAYNKVEARKTIVSLCYIMAVMRNKFVNDFKLEVGLFLSASGSTRNAIDTMNSIGFSAYDYYDIHEKRRPDTVTLSTANHMATCICKQVSNCTPIPIVFNNVIFDIAYTNRKTQWLTNGQLANNTFDQIDLLTVYCYDDAIAERKEECSMKGLCAS
ncbi:2626_t:CDS:2, partial [Funneliformis caledonium]